MNNAPHNSKKGSALIAVLALGVVMSLLVAEFGFLLRGDLKAASVYYDEARCYQLARSAIALAQMELNRDKGYVDDYGNVYFLSSTASYESAIEDLKIYRQGYPLGKGVAAYALIDKSNNLDLGELNAQQWNRLFEVACEMDEGDDRTALVNCAMDWIDSDDIQRSLGAEEDTYESLDTPRYIRNGPPDFTEELLQVYGFTRSILYGDNIPLREDSGMLFGGGLFHYIIGDISSEGRTSIEYIMTGITSEDSMEDAPEEDEVEYTQLESPPVELYLLGRGTIGDAEHIILAKLEYIDEAYQVTEWHDRADRKTIERLKSYGLEQTDVFLTEESDYDS